MPYRQAHLYVIATILAAVVAFWPTYYGTLATAPWGFHFHGLTATVWMLLLAGQGWSAHARRLDLHRALGRAALFYFPVFLAGLAAVVLNMARLTPTDPFYRMFGARLATVDAPSVVLIGWLFHRAMAERRRVHAHARYLLATPLPLLVPIVGRLASHHLPAFQIRGPDTLYLFPWGVRIGSATAIVTAAILYARSPRHVRAFLVTGVVLAAQAAMFETVGYTAVWHDAVVMLGRLPEIPMLLATGAAGAAVAWSGWVAGRAPVRAAAA